MKIFRSGRPALFLPLLALVPLGACAMSRAPLTADVLRPTSDSFDPQQGRGSRPAAAERYADRPGELRRKEGRRALPALPAWQASLSVGPGDFGQKTFGAAPNLDDETRGALFQARIEHVDNVVGGGVQLSVISTNGDLHETGAIQGVDAGVFELYPHLTIRPRAGSRFRVPMRVGPSFQWIGIEDDVGDDINFASVSVLLEVEPEVDIVQEDGFRLSGFGAFRAGVGITGVDIRGNGFDEVYSTDMAQFGLQAGLRFQFEQFLMSFSYVTRRWDFDESDVENGTFVKQTDFDFEGVLFSFGARW